jgi:hypothetical protein
MATTCRDPPRAAGQRLLRKSFAICERCEERMIPGISPSVGSASGGNSNYPRQTVLDGRCFEAVFLQSLFDELDKRTRRVEGQRKKIVTITPGAHRTIWPACDTQSSAFLCKSAGKACHVLAARHASLFVLLRADSGDQCKRKLASQAPKSHSATMLAKPKRIANTVRKCGILLFLRSCHQDGARQLQFASPHCLSQGSQLCRLSLEANHRRNLGAMA